MQIYPAIDIQGGRVVRADHDGKPAAIYGRDPLAQAERFLADGAEWLHVVDVDRAFCTGGDNDVWVRRLAALPISLQVGGGLSTSEQVGRMLALGASRVVVGTAAGLQPPVLDSIVETAPPEALALSIDVRDGMVALRSSDQPTGVDPPRLLAAAVERRIAVIVYRDLTRDGTLGGVDVKAAGRLGGKGAAVIVAGGIALMRDLEALREAGAAGVIVGRALYEGRMSLRGAIECSR